MKFCKSGKSNFGMKIQIFESFKTEIIKILAQKFKCVQNQNCVKIEILDQKLDFKNSEYFTLFENILKSLILK